MLGGEKFHQLSGTLSIRQESKGYTQEQRHE